MSCFPEKVTEPNRQTAGVAVYVVQRLRRKARRRVFWKANAAARSG